MITQILLNFVAAVWATAVGSLPVFPEPIRAALVLLPGQLAGALEMASNLAPVVPFPQAGYAVGMVLTAWAVAGAILIVRQILSYVSGGGGAHS